tara:strand:- start:135 stop:626 length:492 start_codon:yes stop_codon:yes gene_type:complete
MEQKTLIFKLLFIVFFCLVLNTSVQSQKLIKGKAKVIDGDTIHIGNNKIRLHGIDAPEQKQTCNFEGNKWNCGQDATFFLSNLINKKSVSCRVNDIDQYKRLVAVCFIDNININQTMVIFGWAIAYRYYSKDFIKEEQIAKKNKIGIWRGTFEEPYIYRKNNK